MQRTPHTAHLTDWKQPGSYLRNRAWGTVREDYSTDGNAWDHFPVRNLSGKTAGAVNPDALEMTSWGGALAGSG